MTEMPPQRPRRSQSLRQQRNRARIDEAGERARASGASALDVAFAKIDAAFGRSAAINGFKIRVELLLQTDIHHPALRARFGARAEMLAGYDLDAAVAAVERWWRAESKAFAIASALGGGNRLSLDVLRELRLILRLARFKKMQTEFAAMAAILSKRPELPSIRHPEVRAERASKDDGPSAGEHPSRAAARPPQDDGVSVTPA